MFHQFISPAASKMREMVVLHPATVTWQKSQVLVWIGHIRSRLPLEPLVQGELTSKEAQKAT
jgi:hypothetical protein